MRNHNEERKDEDEAPDLKKFADLLHDLPKWQRSSRTGTESLMMDGEPITVFETGRHKWFYSFNGDISDEWDSKDEAKDAAEKFWHLHQSLRRRV